MWNLSFRINVASVVIDFDHFYSGTANPRLMRVVVGQYNFDKIDPEEMAFEIESVTVHPSYQ